MNKFIKIFSFFCVAALLSSCASIQQQITVQGAPDTKIYNAEFEHLGTIQANGTTQIGISKSTFDPYLLSWSENYKTFIPFAIDYKESNHHRRIVSIPAWITYFGGLWQLHYLSCNKAYINHQFEYLPEQQTHQDLSFTNYEDKGPKRKIGGQEVETEELTATPSTHSAATSKDLPGASQSAKTFKDLGNLVSGTYVGTGKLILKGKTIEEYGNMQVVLTKINKNSVNVKVIESSGENFFSSENRYGIEKKEGKYSLTLQGIPTATITIDKNGRLSFRHPKVNIDGDMYTLEISAAKK